MTDKSLQAHDMSDVLELAIKAGFEVHPKYGSIIAPVENELIDGCYGVDVELEAFANLIRADEREQCAKVCDDDAQESRLFAEPFAANVAEILAKSIRERGE
jgi:hypothetical protein